MRGLIVFGFLISMIIVCVLSDTDPSAQQQQDASEVADRPAHIRSKRSPYEPLLPALVLGKSFLLGALVGKSLRRPGGWGWRQRSHYHRGGWGWKPAPVVVHHHAHSGWSGWEEPISQGWGWSS